MKAVQLVKINALWLEFFPAKTYIIIEGKRVPSGRLQAIHLPAAAAQLPFL
jgi:hypothetical protein